MPLERHRSRERPPPSMDDRGLPEKENFVVFTRYYPKLTETGGPGCQEYRVMCVQPVAFEVFHFKNVRTACG